MSELPLQDLRIIAVEQYGAGPWGSVHLADLGADVIKVEDPRTGGDISRYVPPYQDGEDSLFFETFNRNKRSISLELTTPAGRSVFEDLVRHSDAVYCNLRGDVPKRLRLRYDVTRKLSPYAGVAYQRRFGGTESLTREQGGRVNDLRFLVGLRSWF